MPAGRRTGNGRRDDRRRGAQVGKRPVVHCRHAVELLLQIKVERTAEEHVDHLHAAADPQKRIVELVCIAEQQILHLFALGRQLGELAVRDVAAIANRADVLSARQNESVDARQQRLVHAHIRRKRDDDGRPACGDDRLRIMVVHPQYALVRVKRRDDSDDRTRLVHRARGYFVDAHRSLRDLHTFPHVAHCFEKRPPTEGRASCIAEHDKA